MAGFWYNLCASGCQKTCINPIYIDVYPHFSCVRARDLKFYDFLVKRHKRTNSYKNTVHGPMYLSIKH